MEKRMEKIRQWIAEDPTELETYQTSVDIAIEDAIKLSLRNVVPILMIALVIDMTIMFIVPIESTMSRWFWLKTPLSIAVAYLICKFFKSICRHLT